MSEKMMTGEERDKALDAIEVEVAKLHATLDETHAKLAGCVKRRDALLTMVRAAPKPGTVIDVPVAELKFNK